MMLLIAMAITVAYVASMATSLDSFELDFWWELAALVTIMLLGHWQEMKAIGQAQGALSALAELLPDEAQRVEPDATVSAVRLEELRPDDVVLVRPGARVPADGQVVEGEADIDESMITGESRPVTRGVGDRVVAGTVATDSAIRVRVVSVGDDTALAGIQRLVANAQSSGSRAQVLADRFAALLFYVAAAAGLVTFLVWWASRPPRRGCGPHGDRAGRCMPPRPRPGHSARHRHLDRGVSQGGHPGQGSSGPRTDAHGRHGAVRQDRHPHARAPTWSPASPGPLACPTRRCSVSPPASRPTASTRSLGRSWTSPAPGAGSRPPAASGRSPVEASKRPSMASPTQSVAPPCFESARSRPLGRSMKPSRAGSSEERRCSTSCEVTDVLGAFAVEDEVRPEARAAVEELKRLGIRVVMITGDARQVADSVAAQLGIDEVFAEVLPEDKDKAVVELQERGLTVAMVGDGVNDAPALARADVGLAIGAGTDVAIESAGVVLASSDPRAVVGVIRLSRATYRKMRQNLGWAAGYNIVAIPLAAGALAWAGVDMPPSVARHPDVGLHHRCRAQCSAPARRGSPARAPMSVPVVGAMPHSSEMTAKPTRPTTNTRRRASRSPRLPPNSTSEVNVTR